MSSQISRRTVARGAAWSVPVVAIAVAAPAFAVSGFPTVDLTKSCKCSGSGGNNFDFKSVLTFSGLGNYTVTVTAWSFDSVAQPVPGSSFTLDATHRTVVLKANRSSSSAKHDFSATITITNNDTNQTTTLTPSQNQLTYAPNCAAPITCP